MSKDILEKGAILQRDKRTYALVPQISCGLIRDFSQLRKIVDIAEKYGATAIKVTSAQRLAIIGIEESDIDKAWRDLDMDPGFAIGLCVRSVKVCPGATYCRMGKQDTFSVGKALENRFIGRKLPNKLKMAVSGCALSCAESWVRDVGLIGVKNGFKLVVGGAAGAKPRIADILIDCVAADQVVDVVEKIIAVYENMGIKKRLSEIIAVEGIEEFRRRL